MNRPCHCNRALKGTPLDKFDASVPAEKKQCVPCWLALNDPAYQRLWGIHPETLRPLTPEELAALPERPGGCGC